MRSSPLTTELLSLKPTYKLDFDGTGTSGTDAPNPEPATAAEAHASSIDLRQTTKTASSQPPTPTDNADHHRHLNIALVRARVGANLRRMNAELQPDLGGYQLGEELGRGGTSVVYRARRGGRDYALKLLDSRADDRDDPRLQFRREGAALARLKHRGLVEVVELGEDRGRSFLVMSLAEGESLAARLRRGPLTSAEAVTLARQLTEALSEVHRHGLVHRDIKPANIMLPPEGVARLVDFGLVTAGADGRIAGTVDYAAPEQLGLLPRAVGPAADLYALGATLFECLTGRTPFPNTGGDRLHALATTPAPPIASLCEGLRPGLALIIDLLLQKDPDDRYQSAAGLRHDLEALPRLDERLRAGAPPALRTGARSPLTRTALVGFAQELSRLQEAWAKARAGALTFLQIRGDGGCGKTRLATELLDAARADGALVLISKCQALDRTPFGPIREAAAHLISQLSNMAAPGPLVDRLQAAAGDNAALLHRLSPALARLLGAGDEPRSLEPGAEQQRFYKVIAETLGALATAERPVIWLLDDLQWLDASSQQVFAWLARDDRTRHLLVLATARPLERAGAMRYAEETAHRSAPPVSLRPLDSRESAALLRDRLGGRPLDASLVARLAASTQGNPFALCECAHALLDSGRLRLTSSGWHLPPGELDALGLPDDVVALVLRRLRDLDGDTARVLRAAAVVGDRVSAALLGAATGLEEGALRRAVEVALERGLLERTPYGDLAFYHDRIREAVAAELDDAARRDLHQAIADALEAQIAAEDPGARSRYALARHLGAGHASRDPVRVARACLTAGRTALGEHAYVEAYDVLALAAEVTDEGRALTDDDRAALLTALGQAAAMTGHLARAYAALEAALPLARDRDARFELHYLLTLTYASQGRNDDALQALYRSFEVLGRPYPRSRILQAITVLWATLAGLFLSVTGLGRAQARGAGIERRLVLSRLHYAGTMLAMFDGDTFLMVQFILRDFHNVHALPTCAEKAIATTVYGAVLGTFQLRGTMARRTSEGVTMAEALGDPAAVAVCRAYEACGHKWAGDVDRGTELQLEALPLLARDVPGSWYTAMMICEQAYSYQHAGRAAEAHALIDEYLPHLRRTNNRMFVYNTLAVDYAARSVLGDAEGAAALWARLEADYTQLSGTGYVQLARVQGSFEVFINQRTDGPEIETMIADYADKLGEDYYSIYAWELYGYARLERLEQLPPGSPERAAARRALERTILNTRVRALTPIYACHPLIWRAALDRMDGRRARAARRLERAEALAAKVDSPRADYRAALERARLADDPARRAFHADKAASIADEQGWQSKAARARDDFDRPAPRQLTAQPPPSTTFGLDRTSRYAEALLEVSLASATLDSDAQARRALEAVVQVFSAERALLYLLDEDGGLSLKAAAGAGAEEASSKVIQRVLETDAPVVVTRDEDGALLRSESILRQDLRSVLAVPLRLRERTLGVVYLDNRLARGMFTEEDAGLLLGLCNHIAIAVEAARGARVEAERLTLARDLELVSAVQSMLVPDVSTLALPGLSIEGVHEAAPRYGGGWWWAAPSDGGVTLWLGEVSGQGPATAMVCSAVVGAFHALHGVSPDASPERVMAVIHDRLRGMGGGYTMRLTAARLDPAADRLRLWSADGPACLIQRGSGAERLPSAGAPLGSEELSIVRAEAALGDRVLLCAAALPEALPEVRLPELRDRQLQRLRAHHGEHAHQADLTFVAAARRR